MVKYNRRREEYIDRLVDKKIEEYLEIFGAVTIDDYLNVLNRLHIVENQSAYSENYSIKTIIRILFILR